MRRIALAALAFLLVAVAPSVARAQGGEIDNLGEVPPDCAASHRDAYTDRGCLWQTRNGTFSLSPHVVHAGGTLTGTIGNRCKRNNGTEPCPVVWDEMARLPNTKRVSGCRPQDGSCTVRISKKAPTQRYTVVAVGITSDQGTGESRDYYAVLGHKWYLLAGHVTDAEGKPIRGVGIDISGPSSKRRKTDFTGAYNAVLRSGRYVVTARREHIKPVETGDCQVQGEEDTFCHVNLIQNRSADFEIRVPILLFKAKLGAKVSSPERRSLIKAGMPFLIHLTLRNTSRTKRILVWPIYGELSGNASDGHLQPAGMPVRRFTADGTIDEVKPSPYLVFNPKQTREFDVVVRTTASDPFAEIGESEPGGTHAVVKFSPPKLAELGKDNKLKQLDPKKAVEMTEGSDSFTAGIDDSAPAPPPANAFAATWYVTKGLLLGLWNVTWGTVRGLLWDLPKLAIGAISSIPSATFAFVRHEVELWEAIKDDPAQVALFINPLTNTTLLAVHEAPFLIESAGNLYANINQVVSARYNKMWRDWYAGDWRSALTDMTAEGTEQLANVALALAPGVLSRVPAVAEAWNARKAALYARVGEQLAAIVRPGTTAFEAARALKSVLKAGAPLDNAALQELYGLTPAQAGWLRGFAKARKLLITFRSRAQAALKWIEQGALLKPAWIKLKTVNWYDVKYLGYEESDIGRLVVRKPATRAEFYNEIYPKIPVSERAEAAKRWFVRSQEWESTEEGYAKQMFRWSTDKKVSGKWPWQENLVDPAAQADEVVTTGFRLVKRPGRPSERIPQVENPPGSGRWVPITGDVDFLAITKANGAPLADAEHVAVLKQIRAGPVGAMHPETATWRAPESLREKYLGGPCCPAQIGADGIARAVQYNRHLSWFKDPGKYSVSWEGGYFVPGLVR